MADDEVSSTGRDDKVGTTKGSGWDHGGKVDTYRAGRRSYMRDAIERIEHAFETHGDPAALRDEILRWRDDLIRMLKDGPDGG